MATAYKAIKEGFVQNYRMEATLVPLADTYYFEVELNEQLTGNGRKSNWGLPRNKFYDINQFTVVGNDIKNFAISYANTHQGIIATIKDALHNGNRVKLEGVKLKDDPPIIPPIEIENPDMVVVDEPADEEPDNPNGIFGRPINVGDHDLTMTDVPVKDDIPQFELRQVTIYKK